MASENRYGLLILILWPFMGLVSAIRNWRQPWAKNAFWLVCVFMGAIQIFQPNGEILGSVADGGRYVLNLQYMHRHITSFSEVSQSFFNGDTNDIFSASLTYIVSRTTDNGHVFFCVLAIIFGFFYSRNIWYVLDRLPYDLCRGFWVLTAAFFLVCPIWEINGVRMWTALHIFVYGTMPYLVEGNPSKLWWSPAAILVHHSFIFPLIVLGCYILLSKLLYESQWGLTIVFAVYIVSLTVKTIDLNVVNEFLDKYLPSYYDFRVDQYVNESANLRKQVVYDSLSLHIRILDKLKYYTVQVLIIQSFFVVRMNKERYWWLLPLFSFGLILYSFSNIAACVPSGGRFIIVADMFMIPVFMFLLSGYVEDHLLIRGYSYLAVFLAVSLFLPVRYGMGVYGFNLIFGNFFTAFLLETDVPIIDIIKSFL